MTRNPLVTVSPRVTPDPCMRTPAPRDSVTRRIGFCPLLAGLLVGSVLGGLGESLEQESDPWPQRGVLRDGTFLTSPLRGVTAEGEVLFEVSDPGVPVPMHNLVAWGAYADRAQGPLVVLVDGSLLVADILRIDAESVTIASSVWDEVSLPRGAISAIVFRPPANPMERDRLVWRALARDRDDDRLLLENGDELSGRLPDVIAPLPGAFRLTQVEWLGQEGEATASVPLERTVAVLLAAPAREAEAERTDVTLVGLRDGSRLYARTVRGPGDRLEFELLSGPSVTTVSMSSPTGVPWSSVVLLQPFVSQITYLSDLEPISYRHIPFLEATWPYEQDRSVAGGRLRHAGYVWAKGLGMHSASRLAFETRGEYRELHAELAIDERAGRQGSVIFRVYLQDEEGPWRLAYESDVVRGGEAAIPLRVDIQQAQRIALLVDYADRADQWDHANWLNARLVR